MGPSTTGILSENCNPKSKFSNFGIKKLRFRKKKLQTFQQWNKKTKDEFLNPPLRHSTYTAQANEKIKLRNPFLASILSKLHLVKKKHPIETKVAIDDFEKVNLYAYEKTNPIQPEIHVYEEVQHQNSPAEPTQHSIQAEIHVYEEVQHQNLPAEPTQDPIQAEIHAYEEIQHFNLPLETAQHSIQAEIHAHEKIRHYSLPSEPAQHSIQIKIIEKDDFEDVDLHSNNSNNENDAQEKIYSQATGFWACMRKWF
jgi:hypothetical protein